MPKVTSLAASLTSHAEEMSMAKPTALPCIAAMTGCLHR